VLGECCQFKDETPPKNQESEEDFDTERGLLNNSLPLPEDKTGEPDVSLEDVEANQVPDSLSKSKNYPKPVFTSFCNEPAREKRYIFTILNHSLLRIEPMTQGFIDETNSILHLTMALTYHERADYVRRAFHARKMLISFRNNLSNKLKFFQNMLE
jgi:hypothetical protein